MKTKIFFLTLAFTVAFASCSKEADLTPKATTAQTSADYKIEDGTIKFKNMKAYQNTYSQLSNASETELKLWNSKLPFKTLKSKTEEDIKNLSTELTYDSILGESPSQMNPALYYIANSEGVFWFGDTIMKVKGEYIYQITNGDKNAIARIDNNVDVSNDKNIKKILHISPLKPETETQNNKQQKIPGLISDNTEGPYGFRTYTCKEYWIGKWKKRDYIFFSAWTTSSGAQNTSYELPITDDKGNITGYRTVVIGSKDGAYFRVEDKNQTLIGFSWGYPVNVALQYGQISYEANIDNTTKKIKSTERYSGSTSVTTNVYTAGLHSTIKVTYFYKSWRGHIEGVTTITYNLDSEIRSAN